jgi:hypothetical protein
MEIAQSKGIMLGSTEFEKREFDTTPIDFMAWTTTYTSIGISFYVKGDIASATEIKAMMSFAKLNNLYFNSVDFEHGKVCYFFTYI